MHASTEGVQATFGSFIQTDQEKKWLHTYRLLETGSLMEEAYDMITEENRHCLVTVR